MKCIITVFLFMLVGCSSKPSIRGDWYCYDASINSYDWLVFKNDKIMEMIPERDSRNYPKVVGKTGKYQLEDSSLVINWNDKIIEKGKFKSDTILVLDDKVYKKIVR
ncbi:MAG TPA: hypothetical protein VHB70_13380 [Parafilimonas sp.]|nr:hypothetical protein [Parafilimonas sp.]